MTNAGHKPSRDWLNFVATSRARNKIKHFIQAEERSAGHRARAARLLEKEARRFGLSPKTLLESEAFGAWPPRPGCEGDELFADLGYGKVSAGRCWASWCRRIS